MTQNELSMLDSTGELPALCFLVYFCVVDLCLTDDYGVALCMSGRSEKVRDSEHLRSISREDWIWLDNVWLENKG